MRLLKVAPARSGEPESFRGARKSEPKETHEELILGGKRKQFSRFCFSQIYIEAFLCARRVGGWLNFRINSQPPTSLRSSPPSPQPHGSAGCRRVPPASSLPAAPHAQPCQSPGPLPASPGTRTSSRP